MRWHMGGMRNCASAVVEFSHYRSVHDLTVPLESRAVFTPQERVYCARGGASLQSWAGRLAAKRAVAAVLSLDKGAVRTFNDIEILPGPQGEPVVRLSGLAKERLAQMEGGQLSISISHSKTIAIAMAIRWSDSAEKLPS